MTTPVHTPPPVEKDTSETSQELLPRYEEPSICTYTATELLVALGPAQAGSVGGDNIFG